MRVPRIYTSQNLDVKHLDLDVAASHYLARVLRIETGAKIHLFDGQGHLYLAEITTITKKIVSVNILETLEGIAESPLHIHLAIGISKGDRMDWVMQKATELGVTEITPLYTERTEIKLKAEREAKKLQHWQQIIVSACEQCQRNTLPLLHQPQKISLFIKEHQVNHKLVLHHRTQETLQQAVSDKPQDISLLIGPEGGLSEEEIDEALRNGYKAVCFGPRVLRTETAPITAISILQFLWGDLNGY